MEVYSRRTCQETVTIYKRVPTTLYEGTRENHETIRILGSFWPRLESGTFRIRTTELATICELHSYENSGLITDPAGSSADQQQRHSAKFFIAIMVICTEIHNSRRWIMELTRSAASISVPLQEVSQPTFVTETPVTGYLCVISPRRSIRNFKVGHNICLRFYLLILNPPPSFPAMPEAVSHGKIKSAIYVTQTS
jgi:hypothetical protein